MRILIILLLFGSKLYAQDLFDRYTSGTYRFPSGSLAFLAVMYDQFIANVIEFFLILGVMGSVINLRQHTEEIWEKKDALLRDVTESQMASYGIQEPAKFKKGFLSDCFKRHTLDEAEQLLIAGTSTTTPLFHAGMAQMPRPWLFSWVFIRCLVIYSILLVCWYRFDNYLLLPGLIVVGSFVVPFSLLILFYEFNTPKNISFIKVIHITLIGGVLAILISLIIYQILPTLFPEIASLGDPSAGIVEEVAKLAGLIIIMNALPEISFKYRLNALLVGAAVGVGFSAFESAGYAFDTFLFESPAKFSETVSHDAVLNIHVRGILAPFTHIAWTAIAAAAYWHSKKLYGTTYAALTSWKFLRLFLIAVVLHMVWDLSTEFDFLKIILLCIVAYMFTSRLIRLGFEELKLEPDFVKQ